VSEIRSPLVEVDSLGEGVSYLRGSLVETNPLIGGYSNIRTTFFNVEPLTGGFSQVRVTFFESTPLMGGYSHIRNTLISVESLHPVLPELPMSTIPFPGFGNSPTDPSVPAGANPVNTALPGLEFSIHKVPMFKTNIKEAASGAETRNSLSEYPRWRFEMSYEFLEDSTGAESSLKTILGFFLQRHGAYDSWLFKDPDDYLAVNSYCMTTDGVTTQFPFRRDMGGYAEKVGQVDTVNDIDVFLSVGENGTIPAIPGPYAITVAHAASLVEDLGVTKGGVAMTRVTGAPGAGQYAEASGVYTFNSVDHDDAVVISYRYTVDPSDYTVTLPNLMVFDSAPPEGTLSSSFQYYFACRFEEDELDFEKFADKLWNLQECNFRSIIQ